MSSSNSIYLDLTNIEGKFSNHSINNNWKADKLVLSLNVPTILFNNNNN